MSMGPLGLSALAILLVAGRPCREDDEEPAPPDTSEYDGGVPVEGGVDTCGSVSSCDECVRTYPCGFCDGRCVQGSATGPKVASCAVWAFEPPECVDFTPVCGDDRVSPSEGCDDGNAVGGDGCSPGCQVEGGWTCRLAREVSDGGFASACEAECGDGRILGAEACDDGDDGDGDGCSHACMEEVGFDCDGGEPTRCRAITATVVRAFETRYDVPAREATAVLRIHDVAVDSGGNVYVTGGMEGTYDFGGGPLYDPAVDGGVDSFVASFDARGSHRWSRHIDDDGFTWDQAGLQIAIGPGGTVHVVMLARTRADFGGGFTGGGTDGNLALVRYSPGGAYLDELRFATGGDFSPGGIPTTRGLAVDEAGNVYVAGEIDEALDFGGGPIGEAYPSDDTNVYLVSYAPDGTHRWSRAFEGDSDDSVVGLVLSAGRLFVAGNFRDQIDVGGGPLYDPDHAYEEDLYVAAFDTDGAHVWSHRSRRDGTNRVHEAYARDLAADGAGNVYVVGRTVSGLVLGDEELSESFWDQAFVGSFDREGRYRWGRLFGAWAYDAATAVAVDALGDLYVAYQFHEEADVGGATAEAVGLGDALIARYAGDGAHVWTAQYGTAAAEGVPQLVALERDRLVGTARTTRVVDLGGAITSVTDEAIVAVH